MKAPAFQFYADDFIGGVSDMTQAEVGSYILLLCAQWGRGEIPTDAERAALIAKGPVSDYVMRKFPSGKNERLELVRAKQSEYRAAQAGNGARGAKKRWGRHDLAMASPSPENGGAMISPMARNSSPTPTPTPTPISNSKKTAGRAAATAPASDDDWLKGLAGNPAYEGIDVPREFAKMAAWCEVKRKTSSRSRFINWLNRCEKPMTPHAGKSGEDVAKKLGYTF